MSSSRKSPLRAKSNATQKLEINNEGRSDQQCTNNAKPHDAVDEIGIRTKPDPGDKRNELGLTPPVGNIRNSKCASDYADDKSSHDVRAPGMTKRLKLTGTERAARMRREARLTNQQVQLTRIETCFAIVLPSQFEERESILVSSNNAIGRPVQINETALNHKHDQRWFR